MLRHLWTTILDLIYPPKCPVCRAGVKTHGAWCNSCLAQVVLPREINISAHKLSALDRCRVICEYTGGIQRLIRDMKFRRIAKNAVYLSWLLDLGVNDKQLIDIDMVVPVPLDDKRMAERGYNQTELIFKPWVKRHKLCWHEALVRIRPTVPQWELGVKERQRNIKGAFAVTRPEYVIGKKILLVDDIFTTGITMEQCARVLKQAGAERVVGLALASGAQL